MLFETNEEQSARNHDLKIDVLTAKFAHLESQFDKLFHDYQISKEELTSFLENPANFTHETWVELQKIKQNLDQKLTIELDGIKNPEKTKNKYRELKRTQNWIFVR